MFIMKKGYYIHFQGRQSAGVSKKIDMQLEELSKYYDMQELEVTTPYRSLPARVAALFPTASIKRDYDNVFDKLDNPAFLYVRRTVADRAYVGFWKKIKQKFPDCKIIIEIFTYPYDKDDYGKWNAWPFLIKELLYRRYLKRYVDRFVTYTKDQVIFGIPTICTTNGVNVDSIRKLRGEYIENCIRLIGVAYMQRQHGYERVIEGLAEYYKVSDRKYRITLSLVGDGPEKNKYVRLVEKYNLQHYVTFYGTTTGEALDDLYDKADIALAAFGMYKVSYYESIGAIKTRECLAKGIPMISGSPIDVLGDNYPYARIFPNDNSPVPMGEVISLFESIRKTGMSREEISSDMREYARKHAGMDVIMKPVIDFIEKQR